MKKLFLLLLLSGMLACNQQKKNGSISEKRIDSLEKKLSVTYKPGFGEFMSGIQSHHAKLWFAGINQNWKLADFEIHEIMENISAIQKYQTERPESEKIGMINPALDSVNLAIKNKDLVLFKSNYSILTNTCNNCHRATNFEFNVVKIPDLQTFSNQDFKVNGRE
jgi:hypothetical protein